MLRGLGKNQRRQKIESDLSICNLGYQHLALFILCCTVSAWLDYLDFEYRLGIDRLRVLVFAYLILADTEPGYVALVETKFNSLNVIKFQCT